MQTCYCCQALTDLVSSTLLVHTQMCLLAHLIHDIDDEDEEEVAAWHHIRTVMKCISLLLMFGSVIVDENGSEYECFIPDQISTGNHH